MSYKDSEKQKQYNKQYRQKNKEQIREQRKQYRQKNKEQILERAKQHHQKNKELIREQRKQHHQKNKEQDIACLYLILNILTGYIYIGETIRFRERGKDHKRHLKSGRHDNSLLQKDYDKYGADAFEFSIIKEIKKEDFQSEKELKEHLRVEEAMLVLKEAEAGKELYNLALNPIYMVAALQERLAENENNSPSQ
jgi:hypothetical protein